MRNVDQIEPFLFSKSVARTIGEDLPGRYCDVRQQWVIPHNGTELPIVDGANTAICIGTKTSTNTETDDKQKQYLMVQTKTEAQLESEDKGMTAAGLMVQTKTKVNNETDDTQLSADVGWL